MQSDKSLALSSGLLPLASQCGVPWEPGNEAEFTDESFLSFAEQYRTWASERDTAVLNYLSSDASRTLLRVRIPYSERAFYIANQVVWFYDEVVIRDPIEGLVRDASGDLANWKGNLTKTLRVLGLFRSAIEAGYVLLVGELKRQDQDETLPDWAPGIAEEPDVRAALDGAVRLGIDIRQSSKGNDWTVSQVALDSGGSIGWYAAKPEEGESSPPYRVGELLPQVTMETFVEVLGDKAVSRIRGLYPREVARTVWAAQSAHAIGASSLFDREADGQILAASGTNLNPTRQSPIQALNLTLPYVRDIPTTRLSELREKIPNAFKEFRAHIADVVRAAMREDPEHAIELAKVAMEKKAATAKAKILGPGAKALTAVGVLTGAILGVGLPVLLPIAVSGALAAMKADADHVERKAELESHPFYFLWLAHQS